MGRKTHKQKSPSKSRDNPVKKMLTCFVFGCTPKGVVWQHSVLRRVLRRFWEGFWGRVLRRALRRVLRRGPPMGLTVKKGSEKGSQKGF